MRDAGIESPARTKSLLTVTSRMADYWGTLKSKYERAARYPWLRVEPDPPMPERGLPSISNPGKEKEKRTGIEGVRGSDAGVTRPLFPFRTAGYHACPRFAARTSLEQQQTKGTKSFDCVAETEAPTK